MKNNLDQVLKAAFPPVFERSWTEDYPGVDFFDKLIQRAAYERGLQLLQPLPRRILRSLRRLLDGWW